MRFTQEKHDYTRFHAESRSKFNLAYFSISEVFTASLIILYFSIQKVFHYRNVFGTKKLPFSGFSVTQRAAFFFSFHLVPYKKEKKSEAGEVKTIVAMP